MPRAAHPHVAAQGETVVEADEQVLAARLDGCHDGADHPREVGNAAQARARPGHARRRSGGRPAPPAAPSAVRKIVSPSGMLSFWGCGGAPTAVASGPLRGFPWPDWGSRLRRAISVPERPWIHPMRRHLATRLIALAGSAVLALSSAAPAMAAPAMAAPPHGHVAGPNDGSWIVTLAPGRAAPRLAAGLTRDVGGQAWPDLHAGDQRLPVHRIGGGRRGPAAEPEGGIGHP